MTYILFVLLLWAILHWCVKTCEPKWDAIPTSNTHACTDTRTHAWTHKELLGIHLEHKRAAVAGSECRRRIENTEKTGWPVEVHFWWPLNYLSGPMHYIQYRHSVFMCVCMCSRVFYPTASVCMSNFPIINCPALALRNGPVSLEANPVTSRIPIHSGDAGSVSDRNGQAEEDDSDPTRIIWSGVNPVTTRQRKF